MGLFPKVENACPYKEQLSSVLKDDFCTMCHKNVFDLTHMDEAGRRKFISECSGEICVSYRVPGKRLVASAAIAMTTLPALAAAQDASEETLTNDDLYCYSYSDEIIVGGIRDANEAMWIDIEAEKNMTFIPEISDIVDNKEDALLLFALNGMSDQNDEESQQDLSEMIASSETLLD